MATRVLAHPGCSWGPTALRPARPQRRHQRHQQRRHRRRTCAGVAAAASGDAGCVAGSLAEHRLQTGLVIRHVSSAAEVEFLWREIAQERCYEQHGVSLQPGAVVLDVGSNIGLFSLVAAEAVGPSGRVVSIEPAPAAAEALRANLRAHAAWCASRGRQAAPCTVVQAACGDGSQRQGELTTYARAAGWSTLAPDDAELAANMEAFLDQLVAEQGAGRGWSRTQQLLVACARWLRGSPVLAPVGRLLARAYVGFMLSGAATVPCELLSVSDVIRQLGLERVDLLKIDVERAELAVLAGVGEEAWPLVAQVSMEVHDLDGRLAEVEALLRARGMASVVSAQPEALRGSSLHVVWATR